MAASNTAPAAVYLSDSSHDSSHLPPLPPPPDPPPLLPIAQTPSDSAPAASSPQHLSVRTVRSPGVAQVCADETDVVEPIDRKIPRSHRVTRCGMCGEDILNRAVNGAVHENCRRLRQQMGEKEAKIFLHNAVADREREEKKTCKTLHDPPNKPPEDVSSIPQLIWAKGESRQYLQFSPHQRQKRDGEMLHDSPHKRHNPTRWFAPGEIPVAPLPPPPPIHFNPRSVDSDVDANAFVKPIMVADNLHLRIVDYRKQFRDSIKSAVGTCGNDEAARPREPVPKDSRGRVLATLKFLCPFCGPRCPVYGCPSMAVPCTGQMSSS